MLVAIGRSDITLDEAVDYLNVPKGLIKEVCNVLEGAGVLEQDQARRGRFLWVARLTNWAAEILKERTKRGTVMLQDEESQLDHCISIVRDQLKNDIAKHVTDNDHGVPCYWHGDSVVPSDAANALLSLGYHHTLKRNNHVVFL